MKSECIKFHNYAEQIQFSKGVVSTGLKILLIGTEQFKRDILGDKKEIKLSKGQYYDICICEEKEIKQLTQKAKRIKNNIYVVSNDEKSELILEYRKPSMNESKYDSFENFTEYSKNKTDDELANLIEEYSSVILANPEDIYDILEDLYYKSFNVGVIAGKCENLELLTEDIQEDLANINNDFNDGYLN